MRPCESARRDGIELRGAFIDEADRQAGVVISQVRIALADAGVKNRTISEIDQNIRDRASPVRWRYSDRDFGDDVVIAVCDAAVALGRAGFDVAVPESVLYIDISKLHFVWQTG